MNCGEVLRHLGPYLDSECDREVTLAISEHLETCEPCAKRVAREKALEDRMSGRLQVSTEEDATLWRRVESRFLKGGGRRLALIAAAVLVLMAGLAFLVRQSGPSDLVRIACADHVKLSRKGDASDMEISWSGAADALKGRLPFGFSLDGPPPEGMAVAEARSCAFAAEPVALLRCRMQGEPVSVAILPSAVLDSFPQAADEFARKGDAFSCGEGDLHVGLARRGGTLVCVTGSLPGEVLRETARTLAGQIGIIQ